MHSTEQKIWVRWFLVATLFIGACGHPVSSRLVTLELVKDPAIEIQKFSTIGVLPLSTPEKDVGRQLAVEMVKALNHEPRTAKLIQVPKDFQPRDHSLRMLSEKAQVDAVLVVEVTEYSVHASIETVEMLALPGFGPGSIPEFGWMGFRENPTIADIFYYRLKYLEDPKAIKVSVTRVSYALTVQLRLIDMESAVTVWEQEISRRFMGRKMPEQSVGTQVEIERVEASIVDEVVRRLTPQVSRVRRMLRAPRLTTDPKAANLVRQGIQAASQNDWDSAEALFYEAWQEAPTECFIEGNLAVVYERSGKFLDAVSAYERAYRCQSEDPTYRFYSSDLQTAFAPNLQKEDLPILVLGVREDGVVYLNMGKGGRHHPGDQFIIYRSDLLRDQTSGSIKALHENEFAIGEIIEMTPDLTLGRLLLFDPDWEVQRGDLVRFIAR